MSKELYIAHVFNPQDNFGGMTFAIAPVRTPENEVLYLKVGVAVCSTTDNYSRKYGKEVAESNLAKLEETMAKCKDECADWSKTARSIIVNDTKLITGFTMSVEDIAKIFWEDIHTTYGDVYSDSFGFKADGAKLIEGFNFRSYTMRAMLQYMYISLTEMHDLRLPPWLDKCLSFEACSCCCGK